MSVYYCEVTTTTSGTSTTLTYDFQRGVFAFSETLVDGVKLEDHPRRVGIESAMKYLERKRK